MVLPVEWSSSHSGPVGPEAVLPVVSRPPYLRSCQALEQVSGGQLLGLSDGSISLPISACSLFLFLYLIVIF